MHCPLCPLLTADCAEGFNTGLFPDNGVYLIQPLRASRPFPVYCKEKSNARTYILERRSDAVNFNRNFSEYQAGFGDLDGNHWLGLDKVRLRDLQLGSRRSGQGTSEGWTLRQS